LKTFKEVGSPPYGEGEVGLDKIFLMTIETRPGERENIKGSHPLL